MTFDEHKAFQDYRQIQSFNPNYYVKTDKNAMKKPVSRLLTNVAFDLIK